MRTVAAGLVALAYAGTALGLFLGHGATRYSVAYAVMSVGLAATFVRPRPGYALAGAVHAGLVLNGLVEFGVGRFVLAEGALAIGFLQAAAHEDEDALRFDLGIAAAGAAFFVLAFLGEGETWAAGTFAVATVGLVLGARRPVEGERAAAPRAA